MYSCMSCRRSVWASLVEHCMQRYHMRRFRQLLRCPLHGATGVNQCVPDVVQTCHRVVHLCVSPPPALHLFSALVTGVGVGPCITVIGAMVYSSVNLHVTAFWFTSINFSNGVGVVCVEKMYV